MQSGFMELAVAYQPEFLTEPPHVEDSFSLGHLHPEFQLVTVCVGGRVEASNGDAGSAGWPLSGDIHVFYRL